MLKRTAIIDIGSNSARLVIFEQTSRYGFHLICEQKSKVRIGEGAYEKNGYLQPIGIRRAYLALKSFLHTINKYQVNTIQCVATSALRDAPNGADFTTWIQKELKLSIQIIDGQTEAKYGAIAANNLLSLDRYASSVTIDIGGGSSDLALIQNGKIIDTYSLDLGTVRLKELFFDKDEKNNFSTHNKAKKFIKKALQALPPHFKSPVAVGIGGTARTLSKAIMKHTDYPLDKLHGFTYTIESYQTYLTEISLSTIKNLKHFALNKNRFDTIREGTMIFIEILSAIEAKEVISSSVGVREGVFLEQFLKNKALKFPQDINPSIHSILDRFKPLITIEKKRKMKRKIALQLYEVLQEHILDNKRYEKELLYALQLTNIGKNLTIYKAHQHAFYIARQELNYGFTHQESLLIAMLLRMHGKKLLHKTLYLQYHTLLPQKEHLRWLSFIYSLSIYLHEASNQAHFRFTFKKKTLTIHANKPLYLAIEKIKALKKPIDFIIIIKDETALPHCKALGI